MPGTANDPVRSLLAKLPQARFLPKPEGCVTIFRDYVLDTDQGAADEFVRAAGGSIHEAPVHEQPMMSAAPEHATLTAGEKYYVIPASALQG